jgi:hypothetical protein
MSRICAWPLSRMPTRSCGLAARYTVFGLERPVEVCGSHATQARKQGLEVTPLDQLAETRLEPSLSTNESSSTAE